MSKKIKATKTIKNQQTKKQQQVVLVASLVIGAVVLAVIVFLSQRSTGTTIAIEENDIFSGVPIGGVYANAREVTRAADVAESVERGVHENGIPYIGSLDAPIVLADFSNYTCPHCAEFEPILEEVIKDYARSGQVLVEYYPMTNSTESTNATRGAICAAQQGGFWEMHNELYRILRAESLRAFNGGRIEEAANAIGLDGSKVRACMNTNTADDTILHVRDTAAANGVSATPTLLYRLKGSDTWNTLPSSDGDIAGGRSYESLAALIERANN